MADSYVDLSGDGSNTLFSFAFPYINKDHIKVYVDGVDTAYAWNNSSTVEVTPAPANGVVVRVQRVTPRTPLVDFGDGNVLREADLDKATLQAVYLTQETSDILGDLLQRDATGVFDAGASRIVNVADPVDAQDVVTKAWAETGMASELALANAARDTAVAARDAALAAQAAAELARDGAVAAQAAALASEATALAHKNAAAASAAAAALDKAAAETARDAALASQSAASTSEGNAAASASASAASAAAAASSEANAAASAAAAAASEASASSSAATASAIATMLNINQGVSTTDSPTFAGLITGLVQIFSHAAGTADAIVLTNWWGESSRIAGERSLTIAADYNNNSNSAQSAIIFETDGTQKAVITSHGRLGIGTTSPLQPLHVFGASILEGNVAVGTTDFSADLGYTSRLKIGGSGPALVLAEDDTGQRWALAALNSDLVIRDGTTPGPIFVAKGGMNGQPLELNADGFVEFLQGYKETVHTISGTTPALDPINGTIQVWTLTANSTPTDSIGDGESLTLMIDDGAAYTVTWPAITWVNNGGSAPTLATSGYTTVTLWKVGGVLYGALVGDGS